MHSPGGERRVRLEAARLYLVIEAAAALGGVAAEALAGGVDIVQLRDKHASDDEIVAAGRALRALCDRHEALLIVNDRADLALACGADGVHVGQDDEPPASVRRTVGPELLIGLSTHSQEQIAAGERGEADYLGVGPVYTTATKPGLEPVGLQLVAHAAATAGKPWFAIGGIDLERTPEVVRAGARRIAVVRAIRDAGDPLIAAGMLREIVEPRLSRSEARNVAARAALRPLRPGERPAAVVAGAVVAAALALANVVLYALGAKIGGQRPSLAQVAGPALILGVAAWGMWRLRYWAVLGVEALLCLGILFFSLLALRAENLASVLVALALIAPCGALFWFLIRAMARIQISSDDA